MKINLQIKNFSKYLSTANLIECLNLLPDKYKTLTNEVYIFPSYTSYLLFTLKHFQILSFYSALISIILSLFSSSIDFGYYVVFSKNIYIFENNILKYIDSRLNTVKSNSKYETYKSYITNEIILNYRSMWTKYVLLDSLIHELTHALQHKEKRLSNIFINKSKKWNSLENEIEAVSESIKIFNKTHKDFIKILKIKGISINHSISPLSISYKFSIKIII